MVRATTRSSTTRTSLPNGTETILIVEDAEDVRILARRTLEERGYTVRVARNAAEALEISAAGNIDVLLTDIVMPQMSGPQLVAEYLATRPAPLVIYMSGYADDALAQLRARSERRCFCASRSRRSVLARTFARARRGRATRRKPVEESTMRPTRSAARGSVVATLACLVRRRSRARTRRFPFLLSRG